MNERLMRVAPSSFAKFVTAFEEQDAAEASGDAKLLWLVRDPADVARAHLLADADGRVSSQATPA